MAALSNSTTGPSWCVGSKVLSMVVLAVCYSSDESDAMLQKMKVSETATGTMEVPYEFT